ncbi:tRNA lysidine(34) synthetase TilS [Planctomicrobium sp. SH668]|uniref:tRNA lysidine(34) synthetase TilS n=1 Tax=Planctomicrobium sp. SH668 TaxID=3448126 RepID=UPI003F5B110E
MQSLKRFATEHNIRQTKILVAVSGGADSVSLLRQIQEIRNEFQLELAVGHFDHAIRVDSQDDAGWVRELACSLGIPFFSARNNAPPANGTSEESARNKRYEFLTQVAHDQGCRWIALGHTADDQAETILHHILRGSGLQGLSGIPAIRNISPEISVMRPLLNVTREQVVEYLSRLQQGFRNDLTNEFTDYTRNRLRHELLPNLKEHFNPRVSESLLRLAKQAGETQNFLQSEAEKLLKLAILEQTPEVIKLQRPMLATAPPLLIREAFSLLWKQQAWPRKSLNHYHLEKAANMLLAGSPKRISFPDFIEASIRGSVIELRQMSRRPKNI